MTGSTEWSWIGACATGTSHAREELPCDDAGACLEVPTPNGAALVAVVSDGAGSASMSRFGSAMVTRSFCQSVTAHLRDGGRAEDIDEALAGDWLDAMRDRIARRAGLLNEVPRSFAATLVGVIVEPHLTVVVHVGDGACALRLAGEAGWRVPSWPAQGEYASTTYFVTDDPQPRISISRIEGSVEEVAVFTDGMERLALDFAGHRAFDRFFESLFPALRKASPGRQRGLSTQLRDFLDSERVTERTDDDKTLVMARRAIALHAGPGVLAYGR